MTTMISTTMTTALTEDAPAMLDPKPSRRTPVAIHPPEESTARRPRRRPSLVVALLALAVLAVWTQRGDVVGRASDSARPAGGRSVDHSASPAPGFAVDRPLQAGERFDVAVHAEGAVGLAAFEATLRFDPAVVLPVGVRLGDFAPAGSTPLQAREPAGGSLVIGSYNASGQAASGAGALAVVTFEAVADGKPEITLDGETTGAFDQVGRALPAALSLRLPGGPIYLPKLDNGAE